MERFERKRRREEVREERRRAKIRRVNEYYMNSYIAAPSALSLFRMAQQSSDGAVSLDVLWLAAVSLTGYYDLGLINKSQYHTTAWQDLKEALDYASTDLPPSANGASQRVDDDGGRSYIAPRRMPLRLERESLRLTLYKHWELEKSMMHSSYVYGSLELNRDKGQRALKSFFAYAGIPPSSFANLYDAMDSYVRGRLPQMFKEHGGKFGMHFDKITLDQFERDLGALGDDNPSLKLQELSASDAVHIVTALLGNIPASLSNTQLDSLPQTADGRRDVDAIRKAERQAMVDNFSQAYDTVLCKDPRRLKKGLELAVEEVEGVQSLARFIYDTKALRINQARQFRWCKIEQPPHAFRHVLPLRRLAVWLLHVFFSYKPGRPAQELPLLLVVHDAAKCTYLVVGVSAPRMAEQNEFGTLFRDVLRVHKNLKFRYDFFDKSVIEVAADDFDRFWSALVTS